MPKQEAAPPEAKPEVSNGEVAALKANVARMEAELAALKTLVERISAELGIH
jgi:hypothetical protein